MLVPTHCTIYEPGEAGEGHGPGAAAVHHRGDAAMEAVEVGLHAEDGGVVVDVDVEVDQSRHDEETPAVELLAVGILQAGKGDEAVRGDQDLPGLQRAEAGVEDRPTGQSQALPPHSSQGGVSD